MAHRSFLLQGLPQSLTQSWHPANPAVNGFTEVCIGTHKLAKQQAFSATVGLSTKHLMGNFPICINTAAIAEFMACVWFSQFRYSYCFFPPVSRPDLQYFLFLLSKSRQSLLQPVCFPTSSSAAAAWRANVCELSAVGWKQVYSTT